MFFARLALLNLSRNLRRTLLSLASIIAGVAVIIIGKGFIGGLEENLIRAEVDTLSGHVQVRPADYPNEGLAHPIDHLWTPEPSWLAGLEAEGATWTARTLFVPTAVHLADAMRVRGIVFDPDTDARVFPRDGWKVDGAIPSTAEEGVLIGKGVARLLKVAPGERIVLQARTAAGAINALEVPVAGVVSVGAPAIDQLGVLVPRALGESLLQSQGATSHILIRLPDRDAVLAWTEAHRAETPPGTAFRTWIDQTAGMMRIQKIRQTALDFLVLALMGMSASGIANTVLMAAYERIREIGTLQALGMTRAGVVRLFVLEGAMMGLVGALTGAAAGAGLVAWYATHGIDLTGFIERAGSGNLQISAMLYTRSSATVVVGAAAFGWLVAVAASIYPAMVASRMVPAEAVRA